MKGRRSSRLRSVLSRKLLFQYAITIFIFAAVFIISLSLSWTICSSITWYDDSIVYRILSFFRDNILIFGGGIMLAGWAVISYYYISKPLYYLDEIVEASAKLTNLSSDPILLPDAVKNVQDELNTLREAALRNSMAAREAEQRKNDLIVYLAHDLKTPLTSVIGYLTLLRDEQAISPDLREKYTNIALNKAERLEALINEFFDITRFNLTQLTLDEENINLTLMLEQLTYEFNPVLAEKSLTWDLNLEPDVHIVCDSDKLQRVFDNLFRNAVNYSYEETSIEVSLVQKKAYTIIQVKNYGKTIAPENIQRVFDQFFRLDASRATSTGGAGLGLAIAKGIVELHGGTISPESKNESITFTVTLPFSRQKIV